MSKRQVKLPSPAMLVALIALCVALGGTVYAASKINGKLIKKGSEPGNRLKKNTVTGKQVRESSLGTVPNATNASTLQGQGPGAFAPSSIEPAHVVGAPGEPPYTNGWTAVGGSEGGVSFYKDSYGIVHLQGNAKNTGASTAPVFTLPPDYRPAVDLFYPVFAAGGTLRFIDVEPNGLVGIFGPDATTYLGLSTISFRVGVTGLP